MSENNSTSQHSSTITGEYTSFKNVTMTKISSEPAVIHLWLHPVKRDSSWPNLCRFH